MKLVLDTCAFLWIISDDQRLSTAARRAYLDDGNEVFLSAVSAWEIAVKHALGKLPLPAPPERFVPSERADHGIEPLPLDEASTLLLGRLPDLHRDPFDRMLICQAIAHGAALLTPDEQIAQYPIRTIW